MRLLNHRSAATNAARKQNTIKTVFKQSFWSTIGYTNHDTSKMNQFFLKKLLDFANQHIKEEGHGFSHFMQVFQHVENAISCCRLEDKQKQLIRYAALLHDVDDKKFFPQSCDYENARKLLEDQELSNAEVEIIIKMISLVSCSTNGNENSDQLEEWMLYPRYADRLEALGKVGIQRAISYANHLGRPMHDETTERVNTIEELNLVATKERFNNYVNKTKQATTTMGHFYDKLVHLSNVQTNNPYFRNQFRIRHQLIVEFIFNYWKSIPS